MSQAYAEKVEALAGELERLAVELDEENFAEQASIVSEAFSLLQGIGFPVEGGCDAD